MGKNFNKVLKEYRHKLQPINIDPTTGAYESEVVRLPDFGEALGALIDARDILRQSIVDPKIEPEYREQIKNDSMIHVMYKDTRKLLNKFRSHLRNNYPQLYEEIKGGLRESETGEQYSTPKAFKKNEIKRTKKIN